MCASSSSALAASIKYRDLYRKASELCKQLCGRNRSDKRECKHCQLARIVLYAKCVEGGCSGSIYDIWKYDSDLADGTCPGCGEATLQPVTRQEAEQAYQNCEQDGCFEENLL